VDAAAAAAAADGKVTVLIRPEQIELEQIGLGQIGLGQIGLGQIGLGLDKGGVTARVISQEYHGHDVVVHLQPERDADGTAVIARLADGHPVPVGSRVTLRTRGPVFAWPRD
jgi:hypothetical protein